MAIRVKYQYECSKAFALHKSFYDILLPIPHLFVWNSTTELLSQEKSKYRRLIWYLSIFGIGIGTGLPSLLYILLFMRNTLSIGNIMITFGLLILSLIPWAFAIIVVGWGDDFITGIVNMKGLARKLGR